MLDVATGTNGSFNDFVSKDDRVIGKLPTGRHEAHVGGNLPEYKTLMSTSFHVLGLYVKRLGSPSEAFL